MAGSFRLFQVAGISVYMHWSWLVVAVYAFQFRGTAYDSKLWNLAEYVALFAIVLMHEFGHALACRQVGGKADHIVLWPLGGIAFVAPPPRPGAVLWSIAAGPLVNVVLVPITFGLYHATVPLELPQDVHKFFWNVAWLNVGLLIFNLLPVYPLDGGQILQSLLWFVIGFAKSLYVVSVIGLIVGATILIVAAANGDLFWVVMAGFVAWQSWNGFQRARLLIGRPTLTRRREAVCPGCGANPPVGDVWVCGQCRSRFDTFANKAVCPGCGAVSVMTACPDCRQGYPMPAWLLPRARPR